MKATGIVRRVDDLGRIVIPKEIHRTLRIRAGEPLELFTEREGEVILKKYSCDTYTFHLFQRQRKPLGGTGGTERGKIFHPVSKPPLRPALFIAV